MEKYTLDHDGLPTHETIIAVLHESNSFPEGWTAEAVALNANRFSGLPEQTLAIRMKLRELGMINLSPAEMVQFVQEETYAARENEGWKPWVQTFGKAVVEKSPA